jgi:hypothetical protein
LSDSGYQRVERGYVSHLPGGRKKGKKKKKEK